ncbi:MAG: hypothetical protein AAFW89_02745 [Bacteroidota bacterium]
MEDAGDLLLEELDGSTILPEDIYTITVSVFQSSDSLGVQLLTSYAENIGGGETGIISQEEDVFLRAPGDVVGIETEITNPFPQFSWEGEGGIQYRIIVVAQTGNESPEALLQAALGTPPQQEGGEFLPFEHVDVQVLGDTYQYPASGVLPLIAGKTYYWQVYRTVQTAADQETLRSDVWTFSLAAQGSALGGVTLSEEARQSLRRLVGDELFAQLSEQGFVLESIRLENGSELTSSLLAQFLEDLLVKVDGEEIIIVEN